MLYAPLVYGKKYCDSEVLTRIRHQDPEFWGDLAKQVERSSAKP